MLDVEIIEHLDIVSTVGVCRPLRGLYKVSCKLVPGVPLRSTPGFMLMAAPRARILTLKGTLFSVTVCALICLICGYEFPVACYDNRRQ